MYTPPDDTHPYVLAVYVLPPLFSLGRTDEGTELYLAVLQGTHHGSVVRLYRGTPRYRGGSPQVRSCGIKMRSSEDGGLYVVGPLPFCFSTDLQM